MARWLIGRVLGAVAVVLATVVACSALVAILVPDEAPRAGVWAGTLEGVRRKLLHGDFGVSRVEPGTVPVADLFARGVALDLALLAGGLVAGTALGIPGGRVSAARPARARPARSTSSRASRSARPSTSSATGCWSSSLRPSARWRTCRASSRPAATSR